MLFLTVKILGSWSLLSAIAAFTWSRCMAEGRCVHVNEIVVEIQSSAQTGTGVRTKPTARGVLLSNAWPVKLADDPGKRA